MGDVREAKPNCRNAGFSASIYVQPDVLPHYMGLKKMAEERDVSMSAILNEAVKQMYYQMRTGVNVCPEAYLALARGDLGVLSCDMNGGVVDVSVNITPEEAVTRQPESEGGPYGFDRGMDYVIGSAMLKVADESAVVGHEKEV